MANPEIERLKAAVIDEAKAADWGGLRVEVVEMAEAWARASADLRAEEAPPGPQDGEWSAWHVCNHVAAWLAKSADALERTRAGQSTTLGPTQAWPEGEPSLAEAVEAATSGWTRMADAVASLWAAGSAGADESVTIRHRLLGELTPREYTVFSLKHLNAHVRQMGELRGA